MGLDDAATHRLLCRGDDDQRVRAMNAVAAAAAARGDAAHLSLRGAVGESSPHTRRILDERFERLPDGAGRVPGDDPEFRVELPSGADALEEALTVRAPETPDGWGAAGEYHWRVYDVGTLLVVRDGEWLYRSIPHHGQHFLNADPDPDLPDRANEALAGTPSVVVPTAPLVEWGDGEYAVTYAEVRAGERTPPLADLRRVYVDADRGELVFDWTTASERVASADSRLGRALGRATLGLASLLGDPDAAPERVPAGDRETLETVVVALETASERVGYDYEIVRD